MAMLNRRQLLAAAATSLSAGALVVDTHAHIYSPDEKRYPPGPKPLRPPASSGTVENLRRTATENGVAGVCIVQATSFYGWDNRFICDTAAAARQWTAGVCTLDPDDPQSPGRIRDFVNKYDIRALRSYPGRDGAMDGPGVQALWTACGRLEITVNVLCGPGNTDALARMLEKYPRQNVVIDHCLNLKAGPDYDPALRGMLRLAKQPNAHAKLTFLATGSAGEYPFRDMHDACRRIIAAYTPGRCVWGSNFPNALWTPKATYAQSLRLFTAELGLSPKAQQAILGSTARRLYFRGKALD